MMSAARGFPSQGSLGLFNGSVCSGVAAAATTGPTAAWPDSVSGSLMLTAPLSVKRTYELVPPELLTALARGQRNRRARMSRPGSIGSTGRTNDHPLAMAQHANVA